MAVADLTLTYTAAITLDGTAYDLSATKVVSNVSNVVRRRMTVPTASTVNVLEIAATVSSGTLTDIDFVAIVNQDSTNFVTIGLVDTGADTAYIKLKAGEIFTLWSTDLEALTGGAGFVGFNNIDTITANFDTADGDIEFLAGEI